MGELFKYAISFDDCLLEYYGNWNSELPPYSMVKSELVSNVWLPLYHMCTMYYLLCSLFSSRYVNLRDIANYVLYKMQIMCIFSILIPTCCLVFNHRKQCFSCMKMIERLADWMEGWDLSVKSALDYSFHTVLFLYHLLKWHRKAYIKSYFYINNIF